MSEDEDRFGNDFGQGLAIIRSRTESLGCRVMAAYARLARLPPQRLATVELRKLVERAPDSKRVSGPRGLKAAITRRANETKLEQLLINLISNATEAVLETGGDKCVISVGDGPALSQVSFSVSDEGGGARDLFEHHESVRAFLTTKPERLGESA